MVHRGVAFWLVGGVSAAELAADVDGMLYLAEGRDEHEADEADEGLGADLLDARGTQGLDGVAVTYTGHGSTPSRGVRSG